MGKYLDKLKSFIKFDRNLGLFFIIILIIGISAGSLFVTILNDSDKELITNYFNTFIDNEPDYLTVLKDNIITVILYVLGIWLLGISVIGVPIIIFLFFSKCFILGFTIGTIILSRGLKGIIISLLYAIPSQLIVVIALMFLSLYAISFSGVLTLSIIKKKTINFKIMFNKYLIVLTVVLILSIIMVLYDTYIMPYLVKNISNLIK